MDKKEEFGVEISAVCVWGEMRTSYREKCVIRNDAGHSGLMYMAQTRWGICELTRNERLQDGAPGGGATRAGVEKIGNERLGQWAAAIRGAQAAVQSGKIVDVGVLDWMEQNPDP